MISEEVKQCAGPISNTAACRVARSRSAKIYRATPGAIHPALNAVRCRSSAIAAERMRSIAYSSCLRSTEVSPNRVRLTRLTVCSRNICRWSSERSSLLPAASICGSSIITHHAPTQHPGPRGHPGQQAVSKGAASAKPHPSICASVPLRHHSIATQDAMQYGFDSEHKSITQNERMATE